MLVKPGEMGSVISASISCVLSKPHFSFLLLLEVSGVDLPWGSMCIAGRTQRRLSGRLCHRDAKSNF